MKLLTRSTAMALSVVPMLAIGVAVTGSVPAQAHSLPKLMTEDSTASYRVRPLFFGYTGDGTGFVGKLPAAYHQPGGKLHWTKWNQHKAVGKGTFWGKNCQPSCAASRLRPGPGTVTASQPKNGHFTRLTLRFRLHGHPYRDVRQLKRFGPYWGWISTSH